MRHSSDPDGVEVILDANALMTAEQFGVDIFSELLRLGYSRWLVPASVMGELESLTRNADKGRDKIAARVALGLAASCRVMGEDSLEADRAIEQMAEERGAAVFTNDKALKKRLFSKGITVVYLRQGRYLEATKKEY
ncbi:MAG TPA: DNA-binding protein [Methanothrix sp.]|nr:DNA-binding protein [Methanothrix sp.]HQE88062.1 DNA-binding protein [Methanothrix sp.]HQI68052.1 DNA-binding protein [Methanothrix sp.]HRS85207.1 DNA-binding protein [Methanothrix sp.]HRT16761.1 DNA-binding protein [Methanothrix sp.]